MTAFRIAVAAALLAGAATAPARATEVLIYHDWSSPSEVAGLTVLRQAFEAKGHQWKDLAIPHDSGSNVSLINMVTGGNPPNIFLEANPGIYRDLAAKGLAFPLDEEFAAIGAIAQFPDAVRRSITIDGKILKVPVGVHIDGMLYYNKKVAAAAGVDPASWTSLDDFFAAFDAIKAKGFIPLALGAEKWQVAYLFHALMASETGGAIYERVYGAKPDRSALDSPAMRQVLKRLRQMQAHVDAGAAGRKWNDATNLVITGKALLQIHGDWMKGEFRKAGAKLGEDYGCLNIPGAKGVVVTVDSWGLLGGVADDKKAAELDFASIVVDPLIQARFAAAKGSSPVRLDAPSEGLDACNAVVHDDLAKPEMQHLNPNSVTDADWKTGIWDVVDQFWNDPAMTEDQAIADLQQAFDTTVGAK
jgi:glucose/mannose transport system substrate-binding protein